MTENERHCHVIVKGSALDCQATPIGAIGELGLVGGAGAAAKVALYLSGHIEIDNDRQCGHCHCLSLSAQKPRLTEPC